MKRVLLLPLSVLILAGFALAASKPHVIVFGKIFNVKLFLGPAEAKSEDIKIRALTVDGKVKEFTTGDAHDITEELFTARRAYRVNDSLPDDNKPLPKWKWQRGGWVLVSRATGRVSQLKLPEFDSYYSDAAWYRDYVAYCGVSEDGGKLYAVVAQIGTRKPIVKAPLGAASNGEMPDSECGRPEWQRQPMRVTFYPKRGKQVSFEVHGRAADLASEPEPKDEESN
jgi:hypothetical protein